MKNDGLLLTSSRLRHSLNLQLFAEEVTDPVDPTTTTETEKTPSSTTEENNPTPDRTFTRNEVTTIVKKRTERAVAKILEKFGIKDKDGIQEYLDNHNKSIKDLEEMNNKYNDLDNRFRSQTRDYLYLKNDVVPEKYGDLDKEFVEGLTEEKLLEVLKNHPEFIKPKVVVPEKLGSEQQGEKESMTEKELAEKLLGVKL